MALDWLYTWISGKLTDWENWRTTSEYNNQLILKTFAFKVATTGRKCFACDGVGFFSSVLSLVNPMPALRLRFLPCFLSP